MKSSQIHWNDWYRILFGNAPPEFLIEVILRVTFIYLLIILCIRLMGKRMASQLSRNETVALSALAASIGIPIQTPDRGLLPAALVAVIVVLGQRFVSRRALHNETFERESQGDIAVLVADGVMQLDHMKRARITRAEVLAQLRSSGILQLGLVSRLYFEAGGGFSLVKAEPGQPGLGIVPEEDPTFQEEQQISNGLMVCRECGRKQTNMDHDGNGCSHPSFVDAAS